jgi:predicted AlkP superfamily pyrophosphatase or phosphodiesterase
MRSLTAAPIGRPGVNVFLSLGLRRCVLQALFGLAALAPLHAAHNRVIVISIDGLKGTTLSTWLERHRNTPNLNEFLRGGALAEGIVGVFPTVTYPSHTTLVTGVSPDVHGIYGNTLFDPTHSMNGAWYWYAQQIRTPTIWDVAHRSGLRTAAVSWPVSVGAKIDANFPEWRIPETLEDKLLYESLCSPGLYAEYAKAYGMDPLAPPPEDPSESDLDDEATRMALFLLRTRKPDLLLVHVAETDHAQHVYGPDSEQEFEALERIDRDIGLIRRQVQTQGLADRTDYVIVSDHGFLAVNHSLNPDAILTSMGLLGSKEHPEQWRVAAFEGGGSFGLIVHHPADREAVALAQKTFRQLAGESEWGIDRIYEGDDLKATGGFANSFLAVGMKPGFSVGGATSGSWLTAEIDTRGMHGFAPGPIELDSSFVAFGPGIEQQHLGRRTMIDIAPTVAHILGIEIPGAAGTNMLVSNH